MNHLLSVWATGSIIFRVLHMPLRSLAMNSEHFHVLVNDQVSISQVQYEILTWHLLTY